MKILLLTTHLNYGGITSYIVSLAQGLVKKGNVVFIASSGGEAQGLLSASGVTCINIPIRTKSEISPKIILSLFRLKGVVENNNIDIIHAHTRVTQVLGILLSRLTHRLYLSTCHGFFKRRFSRVIFPAWGKNVIAISQAVASHLEEDFKVDRGSITIIHNGIDYEKFLLADAQDKENIKRLFHLPMDGQLVGMIARLSKVKGHTFFISAMPRILKNCPKVNFLIVGDGRLKDELETEVKKLGIERSVFFIPMQSDTIKALSIMDCVVSSSLQEGLGLSILEAQAAGIPVAAFAIGGIVSLIENERTGLLVSPGDALALSEAVVRILTDDNLRRQISQQARENVKRNFNLNKMVEDTLRLYLRLKG